MTNGSVVDTTRDVAVIVGIIDAHRARHVVVARRVEGANMVMTDRCRDVTTTSTGTGTWTRRTSGTHTLCISLKYGYSTPIVMDFDGWTRVPIVSMSRDRRHTNTWTLCTHTTRRCTGQKDTRIVYTRPMSSIPKTHENTRTDRTTDVSLLGAKCTAYTPFSHLKTRFVERDNVVTSLRGHIAYTLSKPARLMGHEHTRSVGRSLSMLYLSIYLSTGHDSSISHRGTPSIDRLARARDGFLRKGARRPRGGARTDERTNASIDRVRE